MAREPAITFRGALRILGHYDRPWLDRLDRLLGGVILASGLTPLSALWGWVDQKNEATGLLRKALDTVSGRLTKTGGLARHELVIAAHTTLVLAAFFETLREIDDEAKFTKTEKVTLGTGESPVADEPLVRHLFTAPVPTPSALVAFEENVHDVGAWAGVKARELGLTVGNELLCRRAVAERYRSDYLRLLTAVPEFKMWADLVEHTATRTALTRLEELLTQSVQSSMPRDVRALIGEVNRAELDRPVIDVDTDGYGVDAVFPTVERIFLIPRFRKASANQIDRIGEEHRWRYFEQQHDLDDVLARHFSTPDSTRLPLLLLGHPGAGKSLLTKVLAARLPDATYTVVRVPLRRVDADAHVSTQINEALVEATHGRVNWPDLAEQSADTIRVVLLDGLDELLQATTNDRGGYLTDIVEFQRVEAAMGKPVAVVVTSRTLVADRVRIPHDTTVLKLDEFGDDQIREWLRVWHEVNPRMRRVASETVLAQGELARQPLLLLMLTLYFADPDVVPGIDLSTVELYRRLFDTYARREVTKQAGRVLPDTELADAVRTQLDRLATAALGMFNRGHQWLTEAELSADLAGLGEPAPVGKRLLGEFFFVHAPEAAASEVRRSYEFLHATFAEYLVATKVVEVLAEVAEGAFGRRRVHDPDDELLFALLSHQPLAVQRPIIDFVRDHLDAMAAEDRADVVRTLDLLIPAYRHRRPATRYLDYRPQRPDTVRALAAYSANLVLLRVLTDPDGLEPATLWPDEPGAWPAMVNLWTAGLDAEGCRAMLTTVVRVDGRIRQESSWRELLVFDELNAAHLRGDTETERRLRFGHAALGELVYFDEVEPTTWVDSALSNLLSIALGSWNAPVDVPESATIQATAAVAEVACGVLAVHGTRWSRDQMEAFLRWMMRLGTPVVPSPLPLALAEHTHPGLLNDLRSDPDDNWRTEWRVVLRAAAPESLQQVPIAEPAAYLDEVVPKRWPLKRGHPPITW
ncbi:ATP-binding protein [Actinophytocola sp.]|uniref:NACHT domain-containing protein n=1 Tax=Actinophytocola sp. TaxID=1872138 RepID=UPI002ED60266